MWDKLGHRLYTGCTKPDKKGPFSDRNCKFPFFACFFPTLTPDSFLLLGTDPDSFTFPPLTPDSFLLLGTDPFLPKGVASVSEQGRVPDAPFELAEMARVGFKECRFKLVEMTRVQI